MNRIRLCKASLPDNTSLEKKNVVAGNVVSDGLLFAFGHRVSPLKRFVVSWLCCLHVKQRRDWSKLLPTYCPLTINPWEQFPGRALCCSIYKYTNLNLESNDFCSHYFSKCPVHAIRVDASAHHTHSAVCYTKLHNKELAILECCLSLSLYPCPPGTN